MTEFPDIEHASRETLIAHQSTRLTSLIRGLPGRNQFYTQKLADANVNAKQLTFPNELSVLPFTTKSELVADQTAAPP